MKKTPVELLFDALWTAPKDKFVWQSILIQAKQVEKQEIQRAYCVGVNEAEDYDERSKINLEKYYKETYEQ